MEIVDRVEAMYDPEHERRNDEARSKLKTQPAIRSPEPRPILLMSPDCSGKSTVLQNPFRIRAPISSRTQGSPARCRATLGCAAQPHSGLGRSPMKSKNCAMRANRGLRQAKPDLLVPNQA